MCQYLLALEGRLFYKTYSFPISSNSLTKSQTVENDSISQTTSAELQRQFESASYERLALSRNKEGIRQLAEKGQVIEKPTDILKDPYILEFLKLPANGKSLVLKTKAI